MFTIVELSVAGILALGALSAAHLANRLHVVIGHAQTLISGTTRGVQEEDPGSGDTTNFVKMMAQKHQGKRCVVFYGSQSGTSEAYAIKIAREARARYGLGSQVCDLENFDMENLDTLSEDCVAVFVMSVYGEGEPTDNARSFMDFILDPAVHFSLGGNSLDKLNFVIFGLGNSTYTHYNRVSRVLDARLQELGAKRIGERGEGDDNKSIEEDYLAWQDGMWTALASRLSLEEGGSAEIKDFEIHEQRDVHDPDVYHGELSAQSLLSKSSHSDGSTDNFDAQNPYPAAVSKSHNLFAVGTDRTCLHMEFDIANTGISYEAGDHLGVWPTNPDIEVDRMLGILGLTHCRTMPVYVKALDPSIVQVPFPVPTTYDAIFRHYLDISALAPRQTLVAFAKFAPTRQAESKLSEWGRDRDKYRLNVKEPGYKLAEVLQAAAGSHTAPSSRLSIWKIPFDRIISEIPRLQPRFYSISSSPKLYPDSVHISAVVLRYQSASLHHQTRFLHGLSTNFLFNINLAKASRDNHKDFSKHSQQSTPVYMIGGPRGKYCSGGMYRVPIHVRRSTFRLPASPKIPVIMIGPGTGAAPFRGFIQERVAQSRLAIAKDGPGALTDWAPLYLYCGCRNRDKDFLYQEEWPGYEAELKGLLHMRVAYSRDSIRPDGRKTYVQHLIDDDAQLLAHLILKRKAYIYVCGDAKDMAKEVEERLCELLGRGRGGQGAFAGRKELKLLSDRKRYQLDVWA